MTTRRSAKTTKKATKTTTKKTTKKTWRRDRRRYTEPDTKAKAWRLADHPPSVTGHVEFVNVASGAEEIRPPSAFDILRRGFAENTVAPLQKIADIIARVALTELRVLHVAKVAAESNTAQCVQVLGWGDQHKAIIDAAIRAARQVERVTVFETIRDGLRHLQPDNQQSTDHALDRIKETRLAKLGSVDHKPELDIPRLEQVDLYEQRYSGERCSTPITKYVRYKGGEPADEKSEMKSETKLFVAE